MTSPFLPSPIMYTDIPGGGQLATIVVASTAPTISQNQQSVGTFWLVPEPSTGNLYYLAGFNGGVPQWELISSGSGTVIAVNGTASQITANTAAGVVTLSLPVALVAPGSVTATTTLTATLGNITATNGNIVRGTAGNKDVYSSVATTIAAGANSAGTVTLVAGEAVVATTAVTANSQIRLYRQGVGATGAAALGSLTILTRSAGVSFSIRAVQPANATAAQTTDVSVIGWEIVN